MSEPMSSLEIEDVLASIRRLVSDDLRPANRVLAGKLMLTPALRVVAMTPATPGDTADLAAATQVPPDPWMPDQSTLDAVADANGEHLDFGRPGDLADLVARPMQTRSAMQSAAEAFHSHADEFILSVSDTGAMVLHGDGGRVLDDARDPEAEHVQRPGGHGAVFAVLTGAGAEAEIRVPEASELADAEGGAPLAEDQNWSDITWDATVHPEPPDTAAAGPTDGGAGAADGAQARLSDAAGPLILTFVSARRAETGPIPVATSAEDADKPATLTEAGLAAATDARDLADQWDREAAMAGAAPEEIGQAAASADMAEDAAMVLPPESAMDAPVISGHAPVLTEPDNPADVAVAQDAVPIRAGDADLDAEALAFVSDPPAPVSEGHAADAPMAQEPEAEVLAAAGLAAAGPVAAGPAEVGPEASGPVENHTASDKSADDLASLAPLAEVPLAAGPVDAGPVESGPDTVPESPVDLAMMWDAALEADVDIMAPDLAITAAQGDADADGAAPNAIAAMAVTSGHRMDKPLPGWAHWVADPDQSAAVEEPAPPAPPVRFVATSRRAAKAPLKDPGWADRAEAEIHRQLAAELGDVAVIEARATQIGTALSEPALRDLVRDLIHEELTGKLGERITQNVRRLVQMELQRTTSVQVHEFRTSRADAGTPDA